MADSLVPITLSLAGLSYAMTGELVRAASVLQADYSCALKLTTPVAFKSAISSAAKEGIIVKGAKSLESLQLSEIFVFDKTGTLTNGNQARIAIGSGGFWGKGFLQGTQTKLKYVPEQDTDFIFCTIGEEWGFIGSAGMLIIYLLFLYRLLYIAERQDTRFARVYGYGVVGIFAMHLFINVGMVIGLVPVIGIPLPFFSYGGSSFLSFTILLFLFLKLDTMRIERVRN